MSTALDSLLPHRAPMLWLEALIDCTDTTASATVRFTTNHFAVTDGVVTETALVECVAQTVAAALGHRAQKGGHTGPANPGLLGAVSGFRILALAPLDKTLLIEVRELKRFGPMLLVAGLISCDGERIAEGELSLYA